MKEQKGAERLPNEHLENPWINVYWFARMLISSDKYGAIGKENKLITEMALGLKIILKDMQLNSDKKIDLSKDMIRILIAKRFSRKTGKSERINLFVEDLFEFFITEESISVFVLTIEKVMIPINKALEEIPSNDRDFTVATATAYLDQLGDDALATVIRMWDDAGVRGCLDAERRAVTREFSSLRHHVSYLTEENADIVLTAFVQEFERRLGQKRKSRAGGSLEDVASFLFSYFDIETQDKPEHFQSDVEVDKWIQCKDKWLIGISCKRTLRERWKQVSSATPEVLGRYKIKEIWHLITYDEDLSDDKLSLLGGQRHIFYLRDDSRKLNQYKNHSVLQSYVRPMSQFIDDLRREMGS